MNLADLLALNGKIVLVKSSRDRRSPPTALRGSLVVNRPEGNGEIEIKVAITFPEMFTAPAHQRVVTLDDMTVARLLESSGDEPFTLTLDLDLEEETRDQSLVAPRAHQPE